MKIIFINLLLTMFFSVTFFPFKASGKNKSSSTDTVNVSGDKYHVKWLFKDDFENENLSDFWILEGAHATVSIKNGELHTSDLGIGSTLWNKREFPVNIIVRFKVRPEGGMADNKFNYNLISHAKENSGFVLKIGEEANRTGVYSEYHKFKNYIATLTFKHTRIRKNPDFILLSDKPDFAAPNQTYEIVYIVNNGVIRYYLNGIKIHDVKDENPLKGGKFGLRTWNTKALWDDIEIGVLQD